MKSFPRRCFSSSYQTIQLSVDENRFATVVLNRPEAHNAFNTEMISELQHCLTSPSIVQDNLPKVRALFVTSVGKTFCAGGDLKSMQRLGDGADQADNNNRDARLLSQFLHTLDRLPLPTICLIQGNAFGGGVGLASVCDICVAVKHAEFGLTEVKLGMIPATISPYVVAKIGPGQARRYFLTAERFSAPTAQSIGLLHELCEDAQALQEWKLRFQKLLLGNAPLAMKAAKELVEFIGEHAGDSPLLMEETAKRLVAQRASPEAQHGIKAFLAKTSPTWTN